MKELIKLNHWGYKNWQQWWFDDAFVLKYVHLCFFMIFLHFCRFSLIFINMQIRLFTNLTTGRKTCVKALI